MDTINNIKAKFIPFKCPVCNGFKTVSFKKIPCSACKAKGFIMVNQETGEPYEQSNTTT